MTALVSPLQNPTIMVSPIDDKSDYAFLAAVNRMLAEETARGNAAPDPEMGGLSPEQVTRLIYSNWDEPGSAIQLNHNLSLEQRESSPFFRGARAFLLALAEKESVTLTSAGNLPRAFVGEMIESFLDPKEQEQLHAICKVVNEHDLFLLHIARVVCQVAGLTGRWKGRYRVKKKTIPLLADDAGGELFATLFMSYFRKFNLSYRVQSGPEAHAIQQCFAYTLYRLSRLAKEWLAVDRLTEETLLPGVRDEVGRELGDHPYWTVAKLAPGRIFVPLEDWSLVETEQEEDGYRDKAVRITPLFRAFLQFDLGGRSR